MQKGLIGKKIGMTQIFDDNGNVIPVTVVEAGPCTVVQKKTVENDGYEAVQVGFGEVKISRVNKPQAGHFKKADVAPKKVLKEFRLADTSALNVGDILKADVFAVGDRVDVVGTSKGKGTAGAIKRWNFSRLKETHGSGPVARHAGSLGACSDPSRVFKGKKLAGHLGAERVTVQNLDIVKVDAENNLIAVNKPQAGHFKKADVAPKKVLKEFRLADTSALNVGDILKADVFAVGDRVDVVGTSKGKGTAGAIKRWNFSRLKETHGSGPVARHAGSLGACSDPSRVFKGKKLAGHLGAERVTVQNLDIVKVDAENNLIAVKGAIPGPKGGIVVLADTVKSK